MPTPESIHAEITSGSAGTVRGLGQDLTDQSRTLDDACNGVLDGLSGTEWESGMARDHFHLRGEELYVSISLAAWRVFRCGDLLGNVADEYEQVCDEADAQLAAWRGLSEEQRAMPATSASWLLAMTGLRQRWSDQLERAASDLTDDDEDGSVDGPLFYDPGRDSDEDWARTGAAKDFDNHLAHDTRRGPRIPNSYLNTGEDWVQQGLAYDQDSGNYLMSSHREDQDLVDAGDPNYKQSDLTLINRSTGEEEGSFRLLGEPGDGYQPQHSGGVTAHDGSYYVVSSEDEGSFVYRYAAKDFENPGDGTPVHAQQRFEVPASSYVTVAEGRIMLGRFEEDEDDEGLTGDLYGLTPAQMNALADDPSGRTLERLSNGEVVAGDQMTHVDTPPKVNGATVLPDRIVYSQNHGRGEPSQIIHEPRDGDPSTSHETGSMIEEGTQVGRDLAFMQEAGAEKYAPEGATWKQNHLADNLWAQTHMTVDPGGAGAGEQEIDVEPQSLRSASSTFAGVSDDVGGVAGRLAGISLPAWTMGDVPGASTMSGAIGTQAGKFDDDLEDAKAGAETTYEGLRSCADGYEVTDLEAFDALEHIVVGDAPGMPVE